MRIIKVYINDSTCNQMGLHAVAPPFIHQPNVPANMIYTKTYILYAQFSYINFFLFFFIYYYFSVRRIDVAAVMHIRCDGTIIPSNDGAVSIVSNEKRQNTNINCARRIKRECVCVLCIVCCIEHRHLGIYQRTNQPSTDMRLHLIEWFSLHSQFQRLFILFTVMIRHNAHCSLFIISPYFDISLNAQHLSFDLHKYDCHSSFFIKSQTQD